MSASETSSMCPAGPTIEWLEPKLPDILKNGGSPLSSTKDDSSKSEGGAHENLEMDDCSAAGVRPAESN